MSTRTILLALLATLGILAMADAPELDVVMADAFAASEEMGVCPVGAMGLSLAAASPERAASPTDARR